MNDKPLVSVITTFLNAEKFIDESIQSVIEQDYNNWELILIDDGSSDNSTEIAHQYTQEFPGKIFYYDHQNHINKGISASRNLGIQKSKGKYIATLDSDDIWMPNKLEQQVSILKSNPDAGMVFGDTKWWFSWTGDIQDKDRDCYEHDLIKPGSLELNTVIQPPMLMVLRLRGDIAGPSMSNIMFRKTLLDSVGGFEDVFTGMHEDWVIWAKILISTPVYVSELCWDMTREHPDSCVSKAVKEGRVKSSELFYLDWLKQYFSQRGIDHPELIRALRDRTWEYKHPRLSAYDKRYKRGLDKLKNVFLDGLYKLKN